MRALLVLYAILAQTGTEPESFRAGVALAREGRFDEAETALLQALAESPSHAPSSVALANLYSRSGRVEEARRILEEGLVHHPKGPVLLNELGSLLLESGRPSEAVPMFERALEAREENPRAREGLLRSLIAAGQLAYSLNRDAEAASLFSRAVSLDAGNTGSWIALGKIHYRRRDYQGARTAFAKALAADSENDEAHFYLGEIDRAALRWEDAVNHYQRSDSAASLRGKARALQKLGRSEEAARALETALLGSRDADTLCLLGSVLLEKGDTDAAADALTEARLADPNHLEARYLLGTLLARLGRGEEARAELEQFRELKAFEAERDKLALVIIERPGDPVSYRPLIELYHRNGRDREALPYLEKALQLAPDDPFLLELRERVRDRW